MRSADIMRPGELRERLGLSKSRFFLLQQQQRFIRLEHREASALLGTRVYSRRRVEEMFADKLTLVAKRA